MALPNFTSQTIKSTFQRLIQTPDGITFYDGTGSLVQIGTTDTGSLLTTASANLNEITFTKGDTSTFVITVDTGSGTATDTGSLLITASVSTNTITFTKGDASTFDITVDTGSGGGGFTSAGISGSWQGQNFVSASQTFLSTGQRDGDSAITGSLELSGILEGEGALRTSFTGSVDNPALLIGPLAGNLFGNKCGLILDEIVPGSTLFVPYFVANGNKIFGFGTVMAMEVGINMQGNNIQYGSNSQTKIYADTDPVNNLEIHADGHIRLRANNNLEIYSNTTASGAISASGNLHALVADNSDTSFKTVMYDPSNGQFYRTGSYGGGGGGTPTDTGSLLTTASAALNVLTFTKGDATTFDVTVDTGSGGGVNISGTPSDNQITVWTNANTVEGTDDFKWTSADREQYINGKTIYVPRTDGSGTYLNVNNEFESAFLSYTGEIIEVGTAISTTAGYCYNLNTTWAAADSNSTSLSQNFLGISINAGTNNIFLTKGVFQTALITGTYSAGAAIYLSATAGAMTFTKPTASGDTVRQVGYAIDTFVSGRTTYHKVYFNPSMEFVVV